MTGGAVTSDRSGCTPALRLFAHVNGRKSLAFEDSKPTRQRNPHDQPADTVSPVLFAFLASTCTARCKHKATAFPSARHVLPGGFFDRLGATAATQETCASAGRARDPGTPHADWDERRTIPASAQAALHGRLVVGFGAAGSGQRSPGLCQQIAVHVTRCRIR